MKRKRKTEKAILGLKVTRQRNVKRDMAALRRTDALNGLRGMAKMEELKTEWQQRVQHQATKALARALKKTKQFEMRKLQRSIKQASPEDEATTHTKGKSKKSKELYENTLACLRSVDVAKLAETAFHWKITKEYLKATDEERELHSGIDDVRRKLINSKHVLEIWNEVDPAQQKDPGASKRQLKRTRFEKRLKEMEDAQKQKSKLQDDATQAAEDSDRSDDEEEQPAKKRKAADKKLDRTNLQVESNFVEKLNGQTLGVILDEDAPIEEDFMVAEKKNRPGQKARRMKAESKFGENAKHLLGPRGGEALSEVWQTAKKAKRVVQEDVTAGPNRKERRQALKKSGPHTKAELHPSWVAKQAAKAKQAATVGLGTKVVFDEDGDTCSILAAVKAEDTSGTKQSEDVRKRQCEGSGGSEADRKGGKGKGKGKKIDYQKGSKGGCAADGKISEEKLHPSWEAKLNARKETGIAAFTGTKVTF